MTAATITVNTDTGEVTGNLDDLRLFALPALDGHRADTLRLAFTGNVDIDPMNDDDLQWFKGLRFGQQIDLRIVATVGKTGWTLKTKDDEEHVTHTLGLNIHSIDGLTQDDE